MKIELLDKNNDINSNLEIVFLKDLENSSDKEILEVLDFKAKDESCVLLVESKKIYVGYEESTYDSIAIAIANGVRKLKETNYESAKIVLNDDLKENFKAIIEGAYLGEYKFTKYKSEKKVKKVQLNVIVDEVTKELEKTLKESKIIGKAVNKARDMVNTPPADFYPKIMAKKAEKIADDLALDIKVEGEKFLKENGMNAMLSVGRASVHESKLIHLTYKPSDAKKKNSTCRKRFNL